MVFPQIDICWYFLEFDQHLTNWYLLASDKIGNWSNRHLMAFLQIGILSNWHFIKLAFYPIGKLSNWHFSN